MPQISRRDFGRTATACSLTALHDLKRVRLPNGGGALSRFSSAFKGNLVSSSSPSYETDRFSWNRRFDRRPALIAMCADSDDVVRALEYAEQEKLAIAVRSGGHSLSALSTCDGGVVIDLRMMNAVHCDRKARKLVAQPGARIGQVQAAAAAKGLVANLPTSTEIGVAGAALSAGIGGGLDGLYGTSAQSLLAAACVLPNGNRVAADQSRMADLLWGLRGAGANFAITTELSLQLYEPPQIYEFSVFCPAEAKVDVMHRLKTIAEEYKERLNCGAAAFGSPGKASQFLVMGSFFGSEADGKAVGAKLTQGVTGAKLAGEYKKFSAPQRSGPVRQHFACARWARNIGELKDDVISAFFNTSETQAFERFVAMNMSFGADTTASLEGAAFSAREAGVDLGIWADAADSESGAAANNWTGNLWTLVRGERCARFPTLLGDEGVARIEATYGKNYASLKSLKKKYDPDNVLRLNQNIVPA